jgi:hypothetical protein
METRPFANSKMITVRWASCRFAAILFLAAMITVSYPNAAPAQNLGSHDEAARIVTLEKVLSEGGSVSGEIHNRSSRTLRDVELLIRHTWLWNSEFKPGKDDPGTSVYYTVPGEVPAQGTASFKYVPPAPLPKRSDGYFQTTITIAGFTEIIPQGK